MVFVIRIEDLAKSHEIALEICKNLIEHFKKHKSSKLTLDFIDCNFLYPDYALMLLCTIKYIESKSILVKGNLVFSKHQKVIKYLSSMSFFDVLGVNFEKPYIIDNTKSLEIQKYTSNNQIQILNSVLKILKSQSYLVENAYVSLDYCFNEILDNVLLHSEVNEGWISAQYFPALNSIRLMVCDFGIGIQKALSLRYNFSGKKALEQSIIEGVTNGKGQGHGLFATSEFIRLNKGQMRVISGNHMLKLDSSGSEVKEISKWQGTIIYLNINTNIDVDYTKFTSKYYDYKQQLFEDMFDNR